MEDCELLNKDGTSSSDSDPDTPLIKKKRQTQTVSSQPKNMKNMKKGTSLFGATSIFNTNVYSTCVAETLKAAASGKLPKSLVPCNVSDTDEEEDVENIFSRKKPRMKKPTSTTFTRNRKTAESPNSRKTRTTSNSDNSDNSRFQEYKPHVILLDDESTDADSDGSDSCAEVVNASLSNSQMREPTPPPSPDIVDVGSRQKTRGQRMKKDVKSALAQLERAQNVHAVVNLLAADEANASLVELSPAKDLRELTVKIRSRSGIQRFPLKKDESFAIIFQDMARHENVGENRISMFLGDRRVKPHDTTASVGVQITDIIDCYIGKLEASAVASDSESDLEDLNCLVLRVQGKDPKSRLSIKILKDEPMEKLMREYCSKKSTDYDSVTFQFDGEDISPRQTPEDLDIETDFCIDVIGL